MIKFGTKAETLQHLIELNTALEGDILPLVFFSVKEWREDSAQIWEDKIIRIGWNAIDLIVRSSAQKEDTQQESMAGAYASVMNIRGKAAFFAAVETVIASYQSACMEDQVLIQPMLSNVQVCGVAFTVDPNNGGAYYILNYDESTGSTCSITSGTGSKAKLFYWFKHGSLPESPILRKICMCLMKLEVVFGSEELDVEFALTLHDHLYILQVRPLCAVSKGLAGNVQMATLDRIQKKIRYANTPKPFLFGKRTIFGVMPDWNPAEMIGIRPKKLALSLYKELITDTTWAYQRHNYGYKNLRSFPLMVDFCGLPYIDVRVSFNSFIPNSLDPNIAERLVNYYLDRLAENPCKHDKIEFEIIFSCYTFDLPEKIQDLSDYGFTEVEINEILISLKSLTNQIVNSKTGLWRKDAEKIKVLEKRRDEILQSQLNVVDKIYWLLEDCRRYGTLPFAGLARAAFIAVQILESMVVKGILSKSDYDDFLNDLQTVSSGLKKDFMEFQPKEFLRRYGHLRPGTYDITSPRYDEIPELYFEWSSERSVESHNADLKHFKLSLPQLQRVHEELLKHELNEDVLGLFEFLKSAIESREYAKFVFSKNVSDILRLIGELGKTYGFLAEDCAHCDIQSIKELCKTSEDVGDILVNSIQQGRAQYETMRCICLPPLITEEQEALRFFIPDAQPTYVTMKRVIGSTVYIKNNYGGDLKEKILLIPSADPGYDWIFSHSIAGFITEYGGANSHMAIRAAELGIPAVIGAGSKLFDLWSKASTLEIDASLRKVSRLK